MGNVSFGRLFLFSTAGKVERPVGTTTPVHWTGDKLNVGDSATVATIARTYVGVTSAGEMVFVLSNGNYLLATNGNYPPNSSLPSYSAASYPPCFLAGTKIAVPGGERDVEELEPGSLVMTLDGRARIVRWVGRRTIPSALLPETVRPVRIAAGALGNGLPARDLRVTSDHALLIDGLLVQAGALVNDRTITRMSADELGETFTVFHLELDEHALVLAEGVPAETFVDNVGRCRFDNYDEYVQLHGNVTPFIAEMDRPRIKSSRQLPNTLRRRLGASAEGRSSHEETAAGRRPGPSGVRRAG